MFGLVSGWRVVALWKTRSTTTHSRCVEVREDSGPHLPSPGKTLLHGEQDDSVSPLCPLFALFPRGKKVDVFAEDSLDGLNGVHMLSARVCNDEGNHRCFWGDFLHSLRAGAQPNW